MLLSHTYLLIYNCVFIASNYIEDVNSGGSYRGQVPIKYTLKALTKFLFVWFKKKDIIKYESVRRAISQPEATIQCFSSCSNVSKLSGKYIF